LSTKRQKQKAESQEAAKGLPKIPAFQPLAEIPPDEIPVRLKEDICRWKKEIDRHREYFTEKGINPFGEAHEMLLSFLDNFDKVAGMKAK
jgi:hypothetical protein